MTCCICGLTVSGTGMDRAGASRGPAVGWAGDGQERKTTKARAPRCVRNIVIGRSFRAEATTVAPALYTNTRIIAERSRVTSPALPVHETRIRARLQSGRPALPKDISLRRRACPEGLSEAKASNGPARSAAERLDPSARSFRAGGPPFTACSVPHNTAGCPLLPSAALPRIAPSRPSSPQSRGSRKKPKGTTLLAGLP